MDERPTPDDGTDEVAAQLRRYADAAEDAVSPTPAIGGATSGRRSTRPWFAAAAVVALLGGGVAVFTAVRDDDGRSVRAIDEPAPTPDPAPGPAPDLENTCPAPRPGGPLVDDLHVPESAAMVGVTSATTSDEQGDVDSIRLDIGEGAAELSVADVGAEELAETFPAHPSGYEPVTFEICDPFSANDRRSTVPGQWGVGQDQRLRAELGLTKDGDRAWLVTASVRLEQPDPTTEQLDAAEADLHRLIAAMSWPGEGTPDRHDVCADEPVAAVGSHQLLAVPDSYTLGEPESVDTGAVDMGGEQWTRLPLIGPDGAGIEVISIGTARFTEFLANNAVGIESGSVTIQRCRTSAGRAPAGVEELTEIRRSPERIVIGAQESEYTGWMVMGTGGATEQDVIAVAETFRS